MEKLIVLILLAFIASSLASPTYLEQEIPMGDSDLPRLPRLQKYRLPIYPQQGLYPVYVHYDNYKLLVPSYNQASANAMAHATSHTSRIFSGYQAAANAQASAYTAGFRRW